MLNTLYSYICAYRIISIATSTKKSASKREFRPAILAKTTENERTRSHEVNGKLSVVSLKSIVSVGQKFFSAITSSR